MTADPRWMRDVRAAIAARTTSAAGIGKSLVWCSPMPKKSAPGLLGQDSLLDHVADGRGVGDRPVALVMHHVTEGVEAEAERDHGRFPFASGQEGTG